jgi:hypothetical protein
MVESSSKLLYKELRQVWGTAHNGKFKLLREHKDFEDLVEQSLFVIILTRLE